MALSLFPTVVLGQATDDFDRANAGNLGANWGSVSGATDFGIVSNQADTTAAGIAVNRYTAASAPADQYARVTLTSLDASTSSGIGPAIRIASGAVTLYLVQTNLTETSMYKGVAGSFTQLGATVGPCAVNDVLEISAVGTSITAKKNGVTIIGPITDSAIASGSWGIWGVGGNITPLRLDNWEGGIPGAGPTPTATATATATPTATATATPTATATATPAGPTSCSYSTSFSATENPISEGGRWVNGLATGLDWFDVATTTSKAFGTQTGASPNYTDSTAILTGTWGADQTVEATVYVTATNTTTYQEVEARLRSTMTAHSSTGYEVLWSVNPSDTYCQIVRWDGALGGFVLLDGRSPGVGNGDVVKATIIGTTITCYINGSSIFSVTDSTYSSGNPGMGFYLQFNSLPTATASNYGFSNWSVSATPCASRNDPRFFLFPQ